jgi:oxygen-dependent protoporphyrinogen oxidase
LEDRALIDLVLRELNSIMKVKGIPTYTHVSRWDKAIPQYHLGHLSVVKKMEEFEKRCAGLFLSGNYRGGIAVGDCVMNSDLTARRAIEYLTNTRTEISA